MSDILTVWDAEAMVADWLIAGDDLADGGDLRTAAIISLMTDRAAGPDDVLPSGTDDPRGWWADTDAEAVWGPHSGPLGSHLWLRRREKATERTRLTIDNDCHVALAWMTQIRVASLVTVDTWWIDSDRAKGWLGGHIQIYRGPEKAVDLRFQPLWMQLNGI